jgi:2-dehydropantoate 2-reductase
MKIGIVGAGAVGGYYGAMLQQAGHEVVFLARGEHLQQMRENGLTVHSKHGTVNIQATFTSEMQALATADLLLFTVKSTETAKTAEQLAPILSAQTIILTLQNGVDNEEVLEHYFGRHRVISGVSYISSQVESPGVIKQAGPEGMLIGALDAQKEQQTVVLMLVKLFTGAGITCKTTEKIIVRKWEKLLWNVTFNPVSAAAMVTVGEILDSPLLLATAQQVLKEAVEIGTRMGIALREEVINDIIPGSAQVRWHKTSMLQDREKGRPMEVESLCGYLVRHGQSHQVQTPVLHTLYAILSTANQQLQSPRGNSPKGTTSDE